MKKLNKVWMCIALAAFAGSASAESYSYTESAGAKPTKYEITSSGDKLVVEFCPGQAKTCMKGNVKKSDLQSKLSKDAAELKQILSKDLSAEIVKAAKASDAQVVTDPASKKELVLIRQGSMNVYIPKADALKGDASILKGAIESSIQQMDAAGTMLKGSLPATFKTDDYQKISGIHYLVLSAIQATQQQAPAEKAPAPAASKAKK